MKMSFKTTGIVDMSNLVRHITVCNTGYILIHQDWDLETAYSCITIWNVKLSFNDWLNYFNLKNN